MIHWKFSFSVVLSTAVWHTSSFSWLWLAGVHGVTCCFPLLVFPLTPVGSPVMLPGTSLPTPQPITTVGRYMSAYTIISLCFVSVTCMCTCCFMYLQCGGIRGRVSVCVCVCAVFVCVCVCECCVCCVCCVCVCVCICVCVCMHTDVHTVHGRGAFVIFDT